MAVAAGLGLRLWIVASDLGPPDADEAVVGLMARDVLDGELETFYWGQEYGGSHEALMLAVLLAGGVPTRAGMEILPLLSAAGVAVLAWRIARRLVPPPAAALAGAVTWVGSPATLWMSTKERGFYAVTALLGLGAVLAALRYRERPGAGRAAALGMLAGLGWWASPQIVYLLLPAALVAVEPHLRRRRPADLAAGLAAAAVGAGPWVYTNLRTGFASFRLSEYVPETTFAFRMGRFFREGLAVLLGFRVPVESSWVLGAAGRAGYGAALAALAAAVVVVAWRTEHRWLAAGVAAYPLLFAAFPTSTYVKDPRYLWFLLPLVALVVAVLAARWWRPAVVAAGVLVLCLAAALGTARLERFGERAAGHHELVPSPLGPLVAELRARRIDAAFADYWVAARISLATGGRIAASPVTDLRNPALERAVRSDRRPVYVLFANGCEDVNLQQSLAEMGVPFERTEAGGFAVVRPERPVMPEQVLREWARARGDRPAGAARRHFCGSA